MKRKILLICALTMMMTTPSLALEFQQRENFRLGGANVIHTFNGTATHWNHGTFACNRDKTAIKSGASVGYWIDKNLVVNVKRFFRLEEPTTNTIDLVVDRAISLNRTAQGAQRLGVMDTMQHLDNNSLRLNGDAILGVRLRHFVTGILGML